MDIGSLIGLVVAFGGLLVSVLMEGGSPRALVNPSAAMIVFANRHEKEGSSVAFLLISFSYAAFFERIAGV